MSEPKTYDTHPDDHVCYQFFVDCFQQQGEQTMAVFTELRQELHQLRMELRALKPSAPAEPR